MYEKLWCFTLPSKSLFLRHYIRSTVQRPYAYAQIQLCVYKLGHNKVDI